MNRGLVFFLGILTGVVLTTVAAFIFSNSSSQQHNGLTMFEERGQIMEESSFKIFQVIDENHALANGVSDEEYGWYMGLTVMIIGPAGSHYYDDQIIETTSNTNFYQVGTYRYDTMLEPGKTVPVIALMNNK